MRTTHSSLLLTLAALWGCSGRYDVGGTGMAGSGGQGAASSGGRAVSGGMGAGEPTSGGASSGGSAVSGGMGAGEPTSGAPSNPPDQDEFGRSCVPLGQPPAIRGPYATPSVVWSRLTLLIHGESVPPPAELPEVTTYDWADDVVTQAFGELAGPAAGARLFAQEWVFPTRSEGDPETPTLAFAWEEPLTSDAPALQVLLTTHLGGRRFGIFNEPSFLSSEPGISGRGAILSERLLLRIVPAPPQGNSHSGMEPSFPALTRRQAHQDAVAEVICTGCHALMDPLGFAFENFDDAGQYREQDNGLPVDASGTFQLERRQISYTGSLELGQELAASCDGQRGLADGFVRAALRINGVAASQRDQLREANQERIRQAFVRSEHRSYADLVRAFAQSPLVLKP